MGNQISKVQKMNFEDIQELKRYDNYILINTLGETEQKCLIKGTTSAQEEVDKVEKMRKDNGMIIIYGKNGNDEKIYEKYMQLIKLGHKKTYIYVGGLFEWLLLQDIYGNDHFPTTYKELDILKFKSPCILKMLLLTN